MSGWDNIKVKLPHDPKDKMRELLKMTVEVTRAPTEINLVVYKIHTLKFLSDKIALLDEATAKDWEKRAKEIING